MAQQNDPGGICDASPMDMQANIDNILTRLTALEDVVAQILSGDVDAVQLSDISTSAGWLYDVTYMGIPGWTQTPAGTLIPPSGFTVSEILANAQAAQLAAWQDGAPIGGGGGVTDYITMFTTTSTTFGTTFNFTSQLSIKGTEITWDNANRIYSSSGGIYAFVLSWTGSVIASVEGTTSVTCLIKRTSNDNTLNSMIASDRIYSSSGTWSKIHKATLIARIDFPFYIYISAVQSSTVLSNHSGTLSVTKLGTLT